MEKTASMQVRCVRRYVEIVVPCRSRILSDFPGQLKNWLRVQRVSPSFIVLGNRFSFVVPSLSRRIVGVL